MTEELISQDEEPQCSNRPESEIFDTPATDDHKTSQKEDIDQVEYLRRNILNTNRLYQQATNVEAEPIDETALQKEIEGQVSQSQEALRKNDALRKAMEIVSEIIEKTPELKRSGQNLNEILLVLTKKIDIDREFDNPKATAKTSWANRIFFHDRRTKIAAKISRFNRNLIGEFNGSKIKGDVYFYVYILLHELLHNSTLKQFLVEDKRLKTVTGMDDKSKHTTALNEIFTDYLTINILEQNIKGASAGSLPPSYFKPDFLPFIQKLEEISGKSISDLYFNGEFEELESILIEKGLSKQRIETILHWLDLLVFLPKEISKEHRKFLLDRLVKMLTPGEVHFA